MTRRRAAWLLIVSGLFSAVLAWGETADDFAFFEEEAKVVSASRREQPIRESPVSVDVITAQDIRDSKALDLWDLLRFRVGMDVVDARSPNNNRAFVSVRGFPKEFVSSLLVLVDGRSVYMSDSGGVFWQQMPVQLQDVERIEIVRGPNAALFGSNAGLGVVNIITKVPAGRAGEASGTVGNKGLLQSGVSLDGAIRKFSYRVSHLRREDRGFVRSDGGEPTDFLHSNKANFRGRWTFDRGGTVDLFAGGAWERRGDPISTVAGTEQNIVRNDYQMLRYSGGIGERSSVELTGSRSRRDESDECHHQYDGEALVRREWPGGRFFTTLGASYRRAVSTDQEIYTRDVPTDASTQFNEIERGFLQQSWKPTKAFALTGSAAVERSDTGGVQPAYQAAVVANPHASHTLRASFARAPTIPDLFSERGNARFPPVILLGSDVGPSQLTSYEFAHLGSFASKRLSTKAGVFYMTLRDLIATRVVAQQFFPSFQQTLQFVNGNAAIARGAETELRYFISPGAVLYANYTFEHITDEKNDRVLNEGTPHHKMNFGAGIPLPRGFSFGVDFGYKSSYYFKPSSGGGTASPDIPAYWRVDARLIWRMRDLEFYVAGRNLVRDRHLEAPGGNLEVPRTIYTGATVRFGY